MKRTATNNYSGFFSSALTFFIAFIFLMGNAVAHVPADLSIGSPDTFKQWKTLETEHFRINFQTEHLAYAQKMAAIAEQVHLKTTAWLQWTPENKTEIIINDSFDGANGGATTLPYNRFFIFMNTPSDGELQDHGSWIEMVFTHEYIHILHLDQATKLPSYARNVVGRLFFTFPQIFNPKWITEGLAVYGETDVERGFGRGQGAIYHAMMREEVVHGLRTLDELNYQGYRGTDWPSNQVYLYGYYFFEFLEHRYSKEKIIKYIKNWNKNIIPWRMDNRSRQVLGVSIDELWSQYQQYLLAKFSPEIKKLNAKTTEKWLTSGERLHSNPQVSATGDIYFYQNNGRTEPSIEKLNDSGQHHVATVHGFSMFDWHDKEGLLLSRGELCDNTNIFADLYRWNLKKEKWLRITECGRYPRATWRSDGQFIAAVHVEGGVTRLDLLNSGGKLIKQMASLNVGDSLGDIDWYVSKGTSGAAEGTIVASVKRQATGWNLELLDVATQQWTPLTRTLALESKPQFSNDGKAVYFISDHNNQQDVRRMTLASVVVETLSNSTSYVKNFSVANNQLVLMEYNATGFGLRSSPLGATFGPGYSAIDTDLRTLKTIENDRTFAPEKFTNVDDYSVWPSIRPRAWWATLLSDGADNTSLQVFVEGSDSLGFHRWQLAPQYYIDKDEFGGDASYIFYNRLAFIASRKVDIEQDSDAGNKIPEIKDVENHFQAIYMQPINSLDQSFRIHLGVAKETVDRTIEGVGDFDAEDNLFGLSLRFSNTERYLHSVSKEDGREIKLSFEQYNIFGNGNYDGPAGTMEWREYISFDNNKVLALRWVQGRASSNAKPFQLGGNVDQFSALAGSIGFGLTDYALRGYSSNAKELEGQQISLLSAEWNVPLIEVFNGFMVPPIGLGKVSVTLFADAGKAWDVGDNSHYYSSVGIELKPQVLVGLDNFLLNSSVGVAQGLDEDLGETSVYVKLGVSF